MGFCKKCGAALDEDAVFCQNCGTKVNLKKSNSEKQAPVKKTENCTLIIILKNAGLGEKPKILLDNQEVGKASIYNEVSLSVPMGRHTLLLKGGAGGGRIADINIKESDTVKKCIFDVNIMSLKERYYLDNVYSESENTVSQDLLPANSEELQAENTVGSVTYQRANKRGTISMIAIGVVIGLIVLLFINFNNTNKLDGVYYSSNGLYYSFTKNGGFAMAFLGGTEIRAGATGTYKLEGNKIVIYVQYNGTGATETLVCTYNKSADTITNSAGLVFRRQ